MFAHTKLTEILGGQSLSGTKYYMMENCEESHLEITNFRKWRWLRIWGLKGKDN